MLHLSSSERARKRESERERERETQRERDREREQAHTEKLVKSHKHCKWWTRGERDARPEDTHIRPPREAARQRLETLWVFCQACV